MTAEPYQQPFTVEPNRIAKGGAALGSGPDGRVAFVEGALPGETVTAEPVAVHKSRVDARVLSIEQPSPDRVPPPCRHAQGSLDQVCGGCDWQFVAPERQRQLRVDIVDDCLRRLAKPVFGDTGVPLPSITSGPDLSPIGYRTTVRAAVSGGRAAFRRRQSNDVVLVEECVVAHPLIEEILVEGRFGDASEVVVRVGANTGERLVIVEPTVTDDISVPEGVKLVGRDELLSGRRPHIHEEMAGLRLQISADSFFQSRPDGALAMAQTVGDLLAPFEGTMLDAYCGVGLFGALAAVGRQVVGVESNSSAVLDAEWNLRPHGRIIESRVEDWVPEPVGVVVADPARAGLKAKAGDRLAATGAAAIALVSCDPASLARDTVLLVDRGYRLETVKVFDIFGHTSHVETISLFVAE